MEKIARKPSSDSAQEKLRQDKATWNKDVSTFVNDLIHFKKMMNGWPSKFFKERSRITQPIPADPATIIGSLANDFQEITNRGNGIIQEQVNYAKTRRQKQPKAPAAPTAPTPETPATPEAAPAKPPVDLAKQLGASVQLSDEYLIVEASSALSRFFTHLLSPGIGSSEAARIRKYRSSLLSASLHIYKDLKKIQSSIVGSGPQSIFVASKLTDKLEDNWVFITSGLQAYQSSLPQGVADTGGKIDVPASSKEDKPSKAPTSPTPMEADSQQVLAAQAAIQDFKSNADNFKGSIPSSLRQLMIAFNKAAPDQKEALATGVLAGYRQLLVQLSANNQIPVQTSLAGILAAMSKSPKPQSASDHLEVVAQNFLGKLKHEISPFDKTSAMRLDVYKLAGELRGQIGKIMNHLESGLVVEDLLPLVKEAEKLVLRLRAFMRALSATIRGVGYQPEFMSLLEKGRLTDHGVDLEPKQREHLEKLLRQKQLRDITQMYSRK